MKRLRQIIARVIVFLLLGAIVNVAVAWGCALMIDPMVGEKSRLFTATENELCVINSYTRVGAVSVFRNRSPTRHHNLEYIRRRKNRVSDESAFEQQNELLPHWSGLSSTAPPKGPEDVHDDCRMVLAWGWPFVSLFSEVEFTNVNTIGDISHCICEPVAYPRFRHLGLPIILPTAHILSNSVANTVFYAAVLFVLFFGFAQTRRLVRLRRGRCPKCAYDLRGELEEGCPECGWGRAP